MLLENPKLMALLMPTLHVTVTDSAVKIAFKEQEPAETVTVGTVRTNGEGQKNCIADRHF